MNRRAAFRAWAAAHRVAEVEDPIGFFERMKTEGVPPIGRFVTIMPDGDLDGFGPPDDDEDDSTEGPEDPDGVYEEDG